MKRNQNLWLVAAFFIFTAIVGSSVLSCYLKDKKQWDFNVYYSAALAFREGLNPYNPDHLNKALQQSQPMTYNYPPATLYLYLPFTYFALATAAKLYLTIKIVAVCALLFLWNRIFQFKEYYFLLPLIAPLVYDGALLSDIKGGNISVFEQLFIWLGFYFYTRDKIVWFAAAIILASSFKLVTILLLGLLVTRLRKRDFQCLILAGIAFLLFIVANASFWPDMFAGFVHNMLGIRGSDRGVNNPATWIFISDIFAWIEINLGHPLPVAISIAFYLAIIATTLYVALLVFLKLLSINGKKTDLWRICLVCFLYAVLMPRLKNYSYIILIAPTLYAILSRPLAAAWVPFCGLLLIYTYRPYDVLGSSLAPFYQAQAEYYSLLLAWIVTGLFCYSFLRKTAASTTASLLDDHESTPPKNESLPPDA